MFMDIVYYLLKIIKIFSHSYFVVVVERQVLEILISYHGSLCCNMKYNEVSCYCFHFPFFIFGNEWYCVIHITELNIDWLKILS